MDLRAIRGDLGAVAGTVGFSEYDYEPSDVQDLPAVVVGGLDEFVRLNTKLTQVRIGVAFYASMNDPQDAAARLDTALSTNIAGSFIDALDEVTPADGASWRSCRVVGAGPYELVQFPSQAVALRVKVTLELTA